MDFLTKVRGLTGLTRYVMASKTGFPQTTIAYLEKKGAGRPLIYLARLRKLTDLSWEDIGKMIDEELMYSLALGRPDRKKPKSKGKKGRAKGKTSAAKTKEKS